MDDIGKIVIAVLVFLMFGIGISSYINSIRETYKCLGLLETQVILLNAALEMEIEKNKHLDK